MDSRKRIRTLIGTCNLIPHKHNITPHLRRPHCIISLVVSPPTLSPFLSFPFPSVFPSSLPLFLFLCVLFFIIPLLFFSPSRLHVIVHPHSCHHAPTSSLSNVVTPLRHHDMTFLLLLYLFLPPFQQRLHDSFHVPYCLLLHDTHHESFFTTVSLTYPLSRLSPFPLSVPLIVGRRSSSVSLQYLSVCVSGFRCICVHLGFCVSRMSPFLSSPLVFSSCHHAHHVIHLPPRRLMIPFYDSSLPPTP